MLSSLPRSHGARPAVHFLGRSGVGSPRLRSPVCVPANQWLRQQSNAVFAVSRAENVEQAQHSSCCNRRVDGNETGLGAARALESGVAMLFSTRFKEGGRVSVTIGQEVRRFVTLRRTSTAAQVGHASSRRGIAVQSDGGWPCLGRGGHTPWRQRKQQPRQGVLQQRRAYSSKDEFGGGQHFPHSDQDSLGIFGNSSRRVIKPERIIIVRHGESFGNLDESTYVHVPDWKIPLTKKGFGDGQRAGEKIKEYIGDKPLFIYTSPYLRTKQTLAGLVEAFDTNYIVGVREEPRLTEQQFGNFQNLATIVNSKAERARFGRFYYRFPQGESGLDVYNRATSFIATMFRDFANENIARDDLNVIIVTHGLTLRLLVMRWFQYSIADFEETLNPANGGFVVMERRAKETTDSRFFGEPNAERRDLRHWYELTPESRAHINFREQRQFGSLWKLLSELPDEPGVLPEEFINHTSEEPKKK